MKTEGDSLFGLFNFSLLCAQLTLCRAMYFESKSAAGEKVQSLLLAMCKKNYLHTIAAFSFSHFELN